MSSPAIEARALEVVAMIDGAARARSTRRRQVTRWLGVGALVCLALTVVGAAIDYFGPASPRPRRWFHPTMADLNASEQVGVAALVAFSVMLALALAFVTIRLYDSWVTAREQDRRR